MSANSWNDIETYIGKSNNELSIQLKVLLDNPIKMEHPFADENQPIKEGTRAAHAIIWAKNPNKLWEFDLNAAILMQMRFDGAIGFPGGFVDEGDPSIEHGLNRELKEELNLSDEYMITRDNFLFAHSFKEKDFRLYFYAKQVSYDEFKQIELNILQSSHDWGTEVAGIFRPPLYKISANDDRGIERFLKNKFIGNALLQFLMALFQTGIFTYEQIIQLL